MPESFWNDEGNARYKASYFEDYPGKWRHGDFIRIDSKTHGLIIYGRSDATLNRHGIRIGTAEIYRAVDKISEVEDSLIINLELEHGKHYMPLFVKMKEGFDQIRKWLVIFTDPSSSDMYDVTLKVVKNWDLIS